MKINHDVAIIGAGPYGLSLAAHLGSRKVDFQIFGEPMQFWRDHMPKGMHLKSEGFASSLYDPNGSYTLMRFCNEKGLNFHETKLPVKLETFVQYGVEFQKKFAPHLQSDNVRHVNKIAGGFALRLENEKLVTARRVVVAVGIRDFRYCPPLLAPLPPQFLTHSSEHHDLAPFKGRRVIVVGAGASATDMAALLQDNGAFVQLVTRGQTVRFHSFGDLDQRSVFKKLRRPNSGIGPGLRARFYCDAPWLFHYFPERLRILIVRRTLGPAGAWFMRERVIGRIPLLVATNLEQAEVEGDQVVLMVRDHDGSRRKLVADHVVAATGYKTSLDRAHFLNAEIRAKLKSVEGTPVLSSAMESSVPGLYFLGAMTANSFGPVMRFAFGARFAAPRVARALG
jgi:cation diffusion facilitator CzcD-associated flavoprotein CzcO